MRLNKQAFTLVELIVVITILAILATIGFVSFSGYLAGTRDTNRISQLKAMSDALELYNTKKDLPVPDDKVDIRSGTDVIAYQGYIGKNVLETIEYTESGLDPKDKEYFSYYLTKNKKYFQLLTFLEEPNTDVVAFNKNILNNSFATDYTERYPKTTGKKLGILVDKDNNPLQEVSSVTGSGYLNIDDVLLLELKSYLNDSEYVTGTGITFSKLKRVAKLGGRGYEADYNYYDFLWTDLDPISCPDGFIPVSSDGVFTTKDFCVAKYEMSYAGLTQTDNSGDRNIYSYIDNAGTRPALGKIVSAQGNSPIAEITQPQAIAECNAMGGHLITNNEWMTIARGIEDVSSNWSSGKVGEGFLYNGISNDITMGCDGGNPSALPTANQYATVTGHDICNGRNKLRLYNGQEIWDLSGNVREHVNKANTYDGSGYNDGQTSVAGSTLSDGSSAGTTWDSDGIYDIGDMDKYGSKYHLGSGNGMGSLYYANGVGNNIFLRGASAINSSNAGVFTLYLNRTSALFARTVGFRCVTF